ncbi:thiol-disulfide oxidoreductase DCC family protein [Aeoliella sp.]|uniref:thiol-disulfide oxidoreductase DCC family protein n=1 Tax=Aeoliella sp. TaxID=2795800 RepID=UPI003CCC297F
MPTNHQFEVFYDGECPLCMREIRWFQRLDKQQNILFTDITADAFDADELGLDMPTMMARIHGRLPDGTLVTGVEVFRRLYTAVGWRWPVAASRLPGVRQLLDLGYRVFAKNRLRLTGRCDGDRCAVN